MTKGKDNNNGTSKSTSRATLKSMTIDEKRFKDAYCKALAEALLEKERQQAGAIITSNNRYSTCSAATNTNTTSDNAKKAYKGLCFDFPTSPSFDHTSDLALSLISTLFTLPASISMPLSNETIRSAIPRSATEERLALSNRLIQGVIHICSSSSVCKTDVNVNNTSGGNASNNDINDIESYIKNAVSNNGNISLQSQQDDKIVGTTAASKNTGNAHTHKGSCQYTEMQGANLLSYVMFALGPLTCIQILNQLSTSSLNQVQKTTLLNSIHSFLGSYEHNHNAHQCNHDNDLTTQQPSSSTSTTATATATAMQINELLSSMNQMNILSSTTNTTAGTYSTDTSYEQSNTSNDINNNDDNDDQTTNDNDHDSLQEVWAEESDPDDYDYGNERYEEYTKNNNNDCDEQQQQYQHNDSTTLPIFALLDPIQLSKKVTKRSMLNIVLCLHSLINELSFTKLSHLSSTSTTSTSSLWEQWNMSKVFTDLTLTLLKLNDKSNDHNNTDDDDNDDDDINALLTKHLSMLYIKPLMVLRDFALNEKYNYQNNQGYIHEYMTLLQTLLESNENIVGKFASTNNNNHHYLSPSRMIGLSSFASFCTSIGEYLSSSSTTSTSSLENKAMKYTLYRDIRQVLFQILDEFIDCIELIRPKKMINNSKIKNTHDESSSALSSSSIPTWVRTTMSLLPILDFFTGINSRSDFTPMLSVEAKTSRSLQYGLSNSDSQSMLQSGFFRELLLLYSSTTTSTTSNTYMKTNSDGLTSAQNLIRIKLLRAILIMSIQASSTLGKYASRVPDLTQILYSETFITDHVVDSILWFAFLYDMNSSSTLQAVKMKGTSSSSLSMIKLSSIDMKDLCVKGTTIVCKRMIQVLDSVSMSNKDEFFGAFDDFSTLSNCLSRVCALSQHWVNAMSEDKDQIRDMLVKVLKSLMGFQKKFQSSSSEEGKKDNDGGTNNNKDISGDDKEKSKSLYVKDKFSYSVHCDKIRSSAKFLILCLENTASCNTITMSSKTD